MLVSVIVLRMDQSTVIHATLFQENSSLSSCYGSLDFMQTTIKCPKPELYKTELCRYWCAGLPCKFGRGCWFAHGPEELQIAQFVVPALIQNTNSLNCDFTGNINTEDTFVPLYQKGPGSCDSGISSVKASTDTLSALSSDKESLSPLLTPIQTVSNSPSFSPFDDRSNCEPTALCDMYIWCGYCVMGSLCPYSHSY